MRSCKLPSGAEIPVFGIGTWRMGESPRRRDQELDAVRYALEIGYPMIDTAEMYGDGGAEGPPEQHRAVTVKAPEVPGRGGAQEQHRDISQKQRLDAQSHRPFTAQPRVPAIIGTRSVQATATSDSAQPPGAVVFVFPRPSVVARGVTPAL